ncbi:hypothetical protein IWZ03DRAFT_145318 [Phyllosticta citriasiana]|uniref:Secreted protein n=1 Tax=Phyllosticta citriasiana TaxID=595635 RepID=A0ABR1KT86_9PEZI
MHNFFFFFFSLFPLTDGDERRNHCGSDEKDTSKESRVKGRDHRPDALRGRPGRLSLAGGGLSDLLHAANHGRSGAESDRSIVLGPGVVQARCAFPRCLRAKAYLVPDQYIPSIQASLAPATAGVAGEHH